MISRTTSHDKVSLLTTDVYVCHVVPRNFKHLDSIFNVLSYAGIGLFLSLPISEMYSLAQLSGFQVLTRYLHQDVHIS